jgi:hypothetical protein
LKLTIICSIGQYILQKAKNDTNVCSKPLLRYA